MMAVAASSTSQRKLRGSRSIDGLARALDGRLDVRISHATRRNQVDSSFEEPGKLVAEVEEYRERHRTIGRFKLDQKVHVGPLRVKVVPPSRRAKHFEPT